MIDKDNSDLDVKFSNYFDEYRINAVYNDLIKSEKLSFIRMKELNKKFSINILEMVCEDFISHKNLYILENLVTTIFARFNIDFTEINSEYYAIIRKETLDKKTNLGELIFKAPCKLFVDSTENVYINTIQYGKIFFIDMV